VQEKAVTYKIQKFKVITTIQTEKVDPASASLQHPPKNSFIVWDDTHKWKDTMWMKKA
jgi:1,4-alpha-glucan branching enzyme